MKLNKKRVTIALSLMVAASILTGCGSTPAASSSSKAASGSSMSMASGSEGKSVFQSADAPTFKIILAHGTSETQLGGLNCSTFASEVQERSNGKISVTVYPNGQLGTDAENFTSTQQGTIQMCWAATGSIASYITDLNILSMPMKLTDINECYKLCEAGTEFRGEIDKTFENNGLVCLALHPTAFRTLTSNKKITSMNDLKGLNLRTMDDQYQIEFWKNVGCNATPLAFSELYIALQQGLMDAEENPLDTVLNNNLGEVQKYIVTTNHVPFVSCFMINKDFYNSMPEEYQNLISQVLTEIAEDDLNNYESNNEKAQQTLEQKNGCEVCQLDEDTIAQMKKCAEPVWEKMEKELSDIATPFNNTLATIQ